MSGADLLLHIGMPRSTAILQPALERLRPQLRRHGVAVVGAATIDGLPAVEGWRRDAWPATRRANAFARELAEAVDAERSMLGGAAQPRVLISHDHLLGRGRLGIRDAQAFRPYAVSAMSQVVAALGPRDVQLVLHTHRQDRLMELAQLDRIIEGMPAELETDFPRRFEPVLDYRELIGRLREVPGVSGVVVRPVELADAGSHPFMEDFLGALGLRGALDLSVLGADIAPHPRVYDGAGVAVARAMNPLLEGSVELALLREFLFEHFVGDIPTTDLFDRRERDRTLSAYAETNRELFVQHMPDLPPDSYGDDVMTFALGNVLSQPVL